MTGVDLDGITETLKATGDWIDKKTEELKHRLVLASGEVIRRAAPLTPNVTGELRARSFSGELVFENGQWIAICGYEKNGTAYPVTSTPAKDDDGNLVYPSKNAYAVYVHEINRNYHNGQWKFLEKAFQDFEKEMLEYLASDSEGGN